LVLVYGDGGRFAMGTEARLGDGGRDQASVAKSGTEAGLGDVGRKAGGRKARR